MTDHPRFEFVNCERDDRHSHYHGARAVDFVLGLADWWLDLARQRQIGHCVDPLRASRPKSPSASTATRFLNQLAHLLALHQRRPKGEHR